MAADIAVQWFGDRAVLVPLAGRTSRAALVARLIQGLPQHEVRAGMDAVLVEALRPDVGLLDAVRAVLDDGGAPSTGIPLPGREVVVPVTYDGPDLADVAALLGCMPEALARAHTAQRWEVAFVGFAPGFGYLEPAGEAVLDWSAVPRRDVPRARVPAGSVAVAAGCSAVYPAAMPGGWRLVGTTPVVLFDATAADPTLLHPGDVVRFADVTGRAM